MSILMILFCLLLAASFATSETIESNEGTTSLRKNRLNSKQQHHETPLFSFYSKETPMDFDPNVTEYWFNTTVDHFNYKPVIPQSTFPLRYFVNDQYYQNASSPILFYAGNEAPITQFIKNSGFLWEAAQQLGGMVVFAEHRYYGKSFPFGGNPKWALTPTNISYLTVEQAMADYHTLQLHIRNKWKMNSDAAFIVAGGSYGGNLALWMRLKNPNLWAGAIASSATPLKHLLRESNAFNKIVADVYGNVSSKCPDMIRQGWKELFDQIITKQGRTNIQSELQLCHMPTPQTGHARAIAHSIHGWISGALETMVQYGYPYPTNFYNPVPAYPFRVACQNMLEETTGLGALKAAAQVYYNHTGQAGSCFDWLGTTRQKQQPQQQPQQQHGNYFNRLGQIDRMHYSEEDQWLWDDRDDDYLGDDDAFNNDSDDYVGLAWGYQCCTEVYQPMPTNGITDFELPHKPNKTQYFERCKQQWEGVTPRPNWEEMTFWGSHIQAGSNIFLTSGQLDPWRAAGIQSLPRGSSSSGSIIVRIIDHGAHHLDLRSSNPLDPPSVVQIRKEEMQAMRQWIQEWKELYDHNPPPSSIAAV